MKFALYAFCVSAVFIGHDAEASEKHSLSSFDYDNPYTAAPAGTAASARQIEEIYRSNAARHSEELARARAMAYRRLYLVRVITESIANVTDARKCVAAAREAVRRELEWSSETPRQKEVLDRLQPVLASFAARNLPAVTLSELGAFESWYRGETGEDFYALFDRYTPQTPLVDF